VALAAERPEQLFVLLPLADSGTDSLAGADASGWGVDELMAGLSLVGLHMEWPCRNDQPVLVLVRHPHHHQAHHTASVGDTHWHSACLLCVCFGLPQGPSARGGGAASLPWVLPASQRQQFLAAAARAVRQALSHRPAFDELKLRCAWQ
jgi:hypothetical protein